MASRTVAASVTENPFGIMLCIPEPKSTALDQLRADLSDIQLSEHRRNLLFEQFRVREALFQKEHGRIIGLRKVVESICWHQALYLRTGSPENLVNVSLGDLANDAGVPVKWVIEGIENLVVQHSGRSTKLDDLVGAVGPQDGKPTTGYVKAAFLLPTDLPRERDLVRELSEVFRKRRQGILDPLLAVEDPHKPGHALICEGNHRAAAAFSASPRALVRVRLLRSKEELAWITEGVTAALGSLMSFQDFVERCRQESIDRGLYERGWPYYLAVLGGEHPELVPPKPVRIDYGAPSSWAEADAELSPPTRVAAEGQLPPANPARSPRGSIKPDILELFQLAGGGPLAPEEVVGRLVARGIQKRALPRSMRVLLKYGFTELIEQPDGRFMLRPQERR